LVCYLPPALLAQFFSSCLPTLAWFLEFLSFGFKDTFSPFPKRCLKTKKVVAETKLSEEEKLLEEKTAGFVESIAKTNIEKITKEILEGLSEDTMTATVTMRKVEAKTLKIGPGDQVMQFSENRLSNRVILII
jgi:hypothetical protein